MLILGTDIVVQSERRSIPWTIYRTAIAAFADSVSASVYNTSDDMFQFLKPNKSKLVLGLN